MCSAKKTHIRRAEQRDLRRLADIYNYEVSCGISTLDINPKDMSEREAWFAFHENSVRYPLLVAELRGEVIAYASLSPYREKEAYLTTAELSVYVDKACRGRGAAKALMDAILAKAREEKLLHTIVSVITAGNAVSTKLHETFGFIYCGRIREVGKKFGSYLDIENYALILEER